MLTAEQQRVKTLLVETITLLCKNGLTFKNEFSIEALVGITIDRDNIFLLNINETIRHQNVPMHKSSSSSISTAVNVSTRESSFVRQGEDRVIQIPGVMSEQRYDPGRRLSSTSLAGGSGVSEDATAVVVLDSVNTSLSVSENDEQSAETDMELNSLEHENHIEGFKSGPSNFSQRSHTKLKRQNNYNLMPSFLHFDNFSAKHMANSVPSSADLKDDWNDRVSQENVRVSGNRDCVKSEPMLNREGQSQLSSESIVIKEELPDKYVEDNEGSYTSSVTSENPQAYVSNNKYGVYLETDQQGASWQNNYDLIMSSTSKQIDDECKPSGSGVETSHGMTIGNQICSSGSNSTPNWTNSRFALVKKNSAAAARKANSAISKVRSRRCFAFDDPLIYKFRCSYCGKGFSSSYNLKGHLACHTGVKEFSCSVCGREYVYKQKLKFHMIDVHQINLI